MNARALQAKRWHVDQPRILVVDKCQFFCRQMSVLSPSFYLSTWLVDTIAPFLENTWNWLPTCLVLIFVTCRQANQTKGIPCGYSHRFDTIFPVEYNAYVAHDPRLFYGQNTPIIASTWMSFFWMDGIIVLKKGTIWCYFAAMRTLLRFFSNINRPLYQNTIFQTDQKVQLQKQEEILPSQRFQVREHTIHPVTHPLARMPIIFLVFIWKKDTTSKLTEYIIESKNTTYVMQLSVCSCPGPLVNGKCGCVLSSLRPDSAEHHLSLSLSPYLSLSLSAIGCVKSVRMAISNTLSLS